MEHSGSLVSAVPYVSNPIDLFRPSWQAFRRNWKPFVLVGLAFFGVIIAAAAGLSIVVALIYFIVPGPQLIKALVASPFALAGLGVFLAVAAYFSWAITRLTLEAAKGRTVSLAEVWPAARYSAVKLLGTGFLAGILILIGFLCLIVPGVLLAVWWSQLAYVCVEENKFGFDALSRSRELVRGHFAEVAAVMLSTSAISLIGIVPIVGGLVYTGACLVLLPLPALRFIQLKDLPRDAAPGPVHAMNYVMIVLGLVGMAISSKSNTNTVQPPSNPGVRVENSV